MLEQEVYDLTQTGDEVQAILDNAQAMPTPQQLSEAFSLKADKSTTYTKTEVDNKVAAAKTAAVNEVKQGLGEGTIVPKVAGNLENWEDRDELSVDSEWSDIVRTTAGDESINSEAGATLVSIVPNSDFFASALKATGFNLLRNATALSTGYYFLVPKLPWGSYGTANEPNGVLFTDAGGNNLTPTVRFKKLSDGVPTSLSDGSVCTYTDSHGYRFFTTSEAGYIIVSGITLNQTCAHIGWSRRYDDYVAVDAAGDAGSTIALASIIHACHDYDLLLVVTRGSRVVKDSIEFGATKATWKRNADRVKPTWTNEETEVGSGTYIHTATIAGMKAGGIAECGDIELTINANTISYQDNNADATTDWVKYELATPATGQVTISPSLTVEDWGLEMLVGATGEAVVTTQYAQGYPDAVANMVNGGVQRRVGSLEAQIEALEQVVANIGAEAEGYVRVAGSSSPALSYKHYSFGEPGGFNPASAFTLLYPCLVGTKLSGNDAQVGKILHVLQKLGAVTIDGVAKWLDVDGVAHAIDGSEGDVMICNIAPYYRIMGRHTIQGTEYDVFLMSRNPFTWQDIVAEKVERQGVSPDYTVSHLDSDNVQRMHSVYNPAWNGSYNAPAHMVGKFVQSEVGGVITEEYDADVTLLGGAGGLHTTDKALYTGEMEAMNQNPDTTKTVPYMNETAASVENWFSMMLAEGGTFDVHNADLMGSGFSNNDQANAETYWAESNASARNGMRLKDKDGNWKHYGLGTNVKAIFGESSSYYPGQMVNSWRNPFHIKEAHRALSYAAQNGIAELTWFVFEGNKYKYRSVPGFAGPQKGEMTAVIWKLMASKLAAGCVNPTDGETSIEGNRIEFLHSVALFHGITTQVSPSRWDSGLVFTEDDSGNYRGFMQRDQAALVVTPNGEIADSESFNFEATYQRVGEVLASGEGYARNYTNGALMMPDTNANKSGGGLHTYVGKYNWFTGAAASSNKKLVRGFRRGNLANSSSLSPLYVAANYAPSNAYTSIGFGTCVRILE